jgi:hypothetical protein
MVFIIKNFVEILTFFINTINILYRKSLITKDLVM